MLQSSSRFYRQNNLITKQLNLINLEMNSSESVFELLSCIEHNAAMDILYNRHGFISYVQSDDICSDVTTMNGTRYILQAPIYNLDKLLPTSKFFRCGKGYYINLDSVFDIGNGDNPIITLMCGNCISVSAKDAHELKRIMEEFMISPRLMSSEIFI